jgi:UDP-2-acetamido-2-deoxy-ribo-hexuluronate aminotransferase
MRKIQMVDLSSQYKRIKGEIDTEISKVIESAMFINGEKVLEFQKSLEAYLNVKHVINCANGTDALQIAMMALDLKPGDEVITASFTYIATAEVIALLQLKPVLVDVDPNNFNILSENIRLAITPRTKAIVPVHLFGQCAPMEDIMKIAKEYNLFVIEDTAQAIGAEYIFSNGERKKAGTIGTIGCTSFFPSKNLGCFGDGGAIFTNDDDLAVKLKMIANHGQSQRYYHDMIGVNSRLDTLQAAILNVKIKYLDSYAAARVSVANFYDQGFKEITHLSIPERDKKSTHVFHQYTLRLKGVNRSKFQNYLLENNIPSMIYYPVPAHRQKAFLSADNNPRAFPVTDKLCEEVISLPMHTELDNEQLDHIVKTVKNYLN